MTLQPLAVPKLYTFLSRTLPLYEYEGLGDTSLPQAAYELLDGSLTPLPPPPLGSSVDSTSFQYTQSPVLPPLFTPSQSTPDFPSGPDHEVLHEDLLPPTPPCPLLTGPFSPIGYPSATATIPS
eukprot:GHVR01036976.1.p3 GENE.GHVR01036976.1~~GHVR01036976.1.p3  ORF type:complete len:124 (-),score=12.70 GHVR01036976.1:181-552(-)